MANRYCSECGTALVDGGCQKCAEPEPDASAPEKTKGGWGCLVVVLMAVTMLIGLVSCASCYENAIPETSILNDDGSYMTTQELEEYFDTLNQDAEEWEETLRLIQKQQ